jgi:Zn-dependent peptidase ImmA (M78 family)/DNA-binding XRE family transcriptional regulator
MANVNPEMLIVARESRGISQSELAERIGVSQAKVSKYESGLLGVSDDDLVSISKQLDFPPEFFYQSDKVSGFGSACFYHRKRQRMPVRELRAIQAKLNIFRFQITRLLRGAEIETANRFIRLDVDENGGPAECARTIRQQWDLRMGPIQNVIAAVESAGAIIYKWSFGTTNLDAISQVVPGCPPLIFVNADIPVDRLRFTLMHEVGHIVMHQLPSDNMEEQADQFASEFLMPEAEIKHSLRGLSLPRLPPLKAEWKVSMAALIRRAHDIGRISDRQYRTFFMHLGTNGWRLKEPVELTPEEPSVFSDVLKVHLDEHNHTVTELSRIVNANESRLRKYLRPPQDAGALRVFG